MVEERPEVAHRIQEVTLVAIPLAFQVQAHLIHLDQEALVIRCTAPGIPIFTLFHPCPYKPRSG